MININAEFYPGKEGKLFRLIRTPENFSGHVIYLVPLFEQANQTRHMQTRLALSAYHLGLQSILYDHYGSGDSEGELWQSDLLIWQQDLIQQITELKCSSSKPVFISSLLSSALLLNDKILALIDGLLLAQPEFNGKRFVQQFKRLSLAGDLLHRKSLELIADEIDIAGYKMQKKLLDDLSQQSLVQLSELNIASHWLEWCAEGDELPLSRSKQKQGFATKHHSVVFSCIDDVKFWQSTELELAPKLVAFECQTFKSLLHGYISDDSPVMISNTSFIQEKK
jgi:exosortase A-associated hydrolase 2